MQNLTNYKYFKSINKYGILIIKLLTFNFQKTIKYNWRPPSLSELTSIIFNMELIHLGSESSI